MEANICTICAHTYNIALKRPLGLPCSHSFCQDCLQQLEKANDKRCPVCRKDWGSVRVANLPSCDQLIPVEGQAEKGGMRGTSNEVVPYKEICVQHNDEYIIWCLTCDVPACKICLKLKHKSCDYILTEEKLYVSSLKDKYNKYSAQLSDNKKELTSIRFLVEKATQLEKKKIDYQNKLVAWHVEAGNILNKFKDNVQASVEGYTTLNLDENNCSPFLDELERKIPALPSPLLLHIASAHQGSPDDVDAFVSALQSSVKPRRGDGPSGDELQAAEARDLSIKEAVAALMEGGEWVVSDATSATAVLSVLKTTCFRPKKVEVFWGDVPEELIMDLHGFGNCEKYWTLDCFNHFEEPSSETRASTSTKLSTLIQFDSWGKQTGFRGHLDAAAVKMLPVTTKSVGLVLRDQEDMAAVNALNGVAFSSGQLCYGRCLLSWRGWTDLDLSVAKTFLPAYWKLTWLHQMLTGNIVVSTALSLPTGLAALGIHLHLHLPQLGLEDRQWMRNLFQVMGLKDGSFSNPVQLLLPGALIDPEPLLGVLRDSGQRWKVHLPSSLPQLVPREEVAERYKGYGHSVTWDLE